MDKGGEDAYAISADGTALLVADGVGGWAEDDVDPALYAKSFAKATGATLDQGRGQALTSGAGGVGL